MSDRSFNRKDFIEGDWTTDDVTEESTYAYNRWRVAQQRAQIQEETAAQARFEGMAAEDIATEYRHKMAEEEAAKRPEREYWAARQFMAERPDYVVNPRNGKRIHIHQAAKDLESRGLLQIDPSKIEVKPRTMVSEDALYDMPMDQLEKLARRSRL
jgi:hypothetical protein